MDTVYLLIEESERELDSRLLIAAGLLRHGIRVVVGNQWAVTRNLSRLPKGLVVFKGNNAVQVAEMRRVKAAGFPVASIEEEVFGMRRDVHLSRCYDPGVAKVCDLFLAQGTDHREMLMEDLGVAGDRIAVTGNPRADLLRPDWISRLGDRTNEIHRRFGDYVLVNTNYASVNPGDGDTLWNYRLCVQTGLLPDNEEGRREMASLCRWERGNLRRMVAFIDRFSSAEPAMPILVRPHPSENLDPWAKALAGMPSVRVVREGSHVPWTASARVVVHTSCTTGLEAVLMGRPAVSLIGVDARWEDIFAANIVSEIADDPAEAVAKVREISASDEDVDEGRRRLDALRPYLRHEPDQPAASVVAEAIAGWLATNGSTLGGAVSDTFPADARLEVDAIAARSFRKSSLSGFDIEQRLAALPFGLATTSAVDWLGDVAVRLEPAP